SDGISYYEEGCLSVPGIYGKVRRDASITVRALNVEGESFVLDASGLLAVCIQHEMDHLAGKVFVEYWSRLKQARTLARLKKKQRSTM
ncbi:MAG: peptide deformylase, partial [Pseudomonadota bacterium]